MTIATRFFLLLVAALAASVFGPLAAADDISGTWNLVWDTEGGTRRGVWTVSQDGGQLSVDAEGTMLEGTFTSGSLEIQGKFYSAEAGYSAELKVKGTLQEDGSLKGSGTWDLYAMTFTATKAE